MLYKEKKRMAPCRRNNTPASNATTLVVFVCVCGKTCVKWLVNRVNPNVVFNDVDLEWTLNLFLDFSE